MQLLRRERALRRRADQLDRIIFSKTEVNKEFRIVYFDDKPFRRDRLFEWQREMQRKLGGFGVVIEPIIDRRSECIALPPFAVDPGIGEIAKVLQRFDIDLGQRLQLRARELRLFLSLQPSHREGRIHVVESPILAQARHRAIGRINDRGAHGYPYMRMRLSNTCTKASANHHRDCEQPPIQSLLR